MARSQVGREIQSCSQCWVFLEQLPENGSKQLVHVLGEIILALAISVLVPKLMFSRHGRDPFECRHAKMYMWDKWVRGRNYLCLNIPTHPSTIQIHRFSPGPSLSGLILSFEPIFQ